MSGLLPTARPFKLVHISDIHINAEPILGQDPVTHFRACMASVVKHAPDADAVVITGDLTHHGERASYETLRELISEEWPAGLTRPHLLIGNHDHRETFVEVFPGAPRDANGFVQGTLDTSIGRFVFCDTVEPDTHAGHYCAARQAWLHETLSTAAQDGTHAWLFLHHNPLPVHVANADLIGLVDGAAFRAILEEHHSTVRHIFFGHCHYTLSGSVAGIPFSAPRSTNHPCWPDFSGDPHRMGHGGGAAPDYNIVLISEAGVVVHTVNFMTEGDAEWLTTAEDGWLEE